MARGSLQSNALSSSLQHRVLRRHFQIEAEIRHQSFEGAARSFAQGAAPRQTTPPRQALDRNPSQAWATKMLTLIMANNAVTISIMTTVLCAPHGQNGMAGRTVKRITAPPPHRSATDDFRQQRMSNRWTNCGGIAVPNRRLSSSRNPSPSTPVADGFRKGLNPSYGHCPI